MYEKLNHYRVLNYRVIDGDTIECEIDLGFHTRIMKHVRLLDIDAPEVRGGTTESKAQGMEVKHFAETALLNTIDFDIPIVLHTVKQDSFKRWLGDIWLGTQKLNDLIKDKLTDMGI